MIPKAIDPPISQKTVLHKKLRTSPLQYDFSAYKNELSRGKLPVWLGLMRAWSHNNPESKETLW